jgi:selenide, water dikinase
LDLENLLKQIPLMRHPDLLVGPEHGADAGVFQLSPEIAIVQSADFFPPNLDDPRAFGRVAAANAMSDVYAMGGRPVTALNLLAMPEKEEQAKLVAILDGAREKVEEAGAVICGGHTITSRTIMFGLSVTGVVHPAQVVRNTTPQPGDVLVLTKPIGSGIVIHSHATGDVDDAELAICVETMSTLNQLPGAALIPLGAHASTDITGFGLLGHCLDMLALRHAGYEIYWPAVPLMPRVPELAARGNVPGGSKRNAEYTRCKVEYAGCPPEAELILNDAQTSGGLAIALPEAAAQRLLELLATQGYTQPATIIGRCVAEHPGHIRVTG